MSDDLEFRTVKTSRAELQSFLPTPRLIKAFEDLTANVQVGLPAALEATELVAQNGLLGAAAALGRAESARGAADKLVPAVQALESEAANDRGLSSEVARLTRRLEQVEILAQALNRANSEIQRLQSRIANLETLTMGA